LEPESHWGQALPVWVLLWVSEMNRVWEWLLLLWVVDNHCQMVEILVMIAEE